MLCRNLCKLQSLLRQLCQLQLVTLCIGGLFSKRLLAVRSRSAPVSVVLLFHAAAAAAVLCLVVAAIILSCNALVKSPCATNPHCFCDLLQFSTKFLDFPCHFAFLLLRVT